ncbi:interleukin-22 receptor subunit alpha-1 [Anolis carolinensis]|uniref:interleukin-22 receptor subunit alpha-1 n=1 Tax=Anolis carolinensis TaxID=28377 RepID=UPI002F2B6D2C
MKELLIFGVLCSLVGTSQTERSPLILEATFKSTNFENIFVWKGGEETPPGTLYDVQYKKYGEPWQEKSECQNVTRLFCDLTHETENFSERFYAQVRAHVPDCCTSNWAMSPRFHPGMDTNIGKPEVKCIPSTQSIQFFIQPPMSPLRDGDNQTLTVVKIFSKIGTSVEYEIIVFSPKTQQKWVKTVKVGEFELTDLEADTEYNGEIRIKTSKKTSEPFHFRVRTLPDRTWMPYLFVVILFMIALSFGTMYYLVDKYIKRYTLEQPTALDFKGTSHFRPLVPKVEQFLIPQNLSKCGRNLPEMQLAREANPNLLAELEKHQKVFALTNSIYQEQAKLPFFEDISQPVAPADHLPASYAPQTVKHRPICVTDGNPSASTYGLCIQGTSCANKVSSQRAADPVSCAGDAINGIYKAQNPEQRWMNKANEEPTLMQENVEPQRDNQDVMPSQRSSLPEGMTGSYRKQPMDLLQATPRNVPNATIGIDSVSYSQPLFLPAQLSHNHSAKQWDGWESFAENTIRWSSFGLQTTDCANKGSKTEPESVSVADALDTAPNSGLFAGLFKDLDLKIQWDHGTEEDVY